MSDTSFPDDIEQLLSFERSRPEESSEVLDRLRDRLAITIGPLDAPAAAQGAGSASPHTPSAASATPQSMATNLAATKFGLVALGAFAIGAVSGAKWQSGRTPDPQASALVPVVAASAAPSSSASAIVEVPRVTADAGVAIDITSLPLVRPTGVASAPDVPATASTKDGKDPLAAERTLIDVARTASSRGKLAEATTALDEHAQRFPRGALSEEREGLRIQLLIAQGRLGEARDRVARFRKTFPTSLMLPAIDAQLGTSTPPSDPLP